MSSISDWQTLAMSCSVFVRQLRKLTSLLLHQWWWQADWLTAIFADDFIFRIPGQCLNIFCCRDLSRKLVTHCEFRRVWNITIRAMQQQSITPQLNRGLILLYSYSSSQKNNGIWKYIILLFYSYYSLTHSQNTSFEQKKIFERML